MRVEKENGVLLGLLMRIWRGHPRLGFLVFF
uniref:Uncharacterized protein n=1 Tax=Anguilla anguilla TaxID=7936 RepID=A0A0E9W5X8_ANGAN